MDFIAHRDDRVARQLFDCAASRFEQFGSSCPLSGGIKRLVRTITFLASPHQRHDSMRFVSGTVRAFAIYFNHLGNSYDVERSRWPHGYQEPARFVERLGRGRCTGKR